MKLKKSQIISIIAILAGTIFVFFIFASVLIKAQQGSPSLSFSQIIEEITPVVQERIESTALKELVLALLNEIKNRDPQNLNAEEIQNILKNLKPQIVEAVLSKVFKDLGPEIEKGISDKARQRGASPEDIRKLIIGATQEAEKIAPKIVDDVLTKYIPELAQIFGRLAKILNECFKDFEHLSEAIKDDIKSALTKHVEDWASKKGEELAFAQIKEELNKGKNEFAGTDKEKQKQWDDLFTEEFIKGELLPINKAYGRRGVETAIKLWIRARLILDDLMAQRDRLNSDIIKAQQLIDSPGLKKLEWWQTLPFVHDVVQAKIKALEDQGKEIKDNLIKARDILNSFINKVKNMDSNASELDRLLKSLDFYFSMAQRGLVAYHGLIPKTEDNKEELTEIKSAATDLFQKINKLRTDIISGAAERLAKLLDFLKNNPWPPPLIESTSKSITAYINTYTSDGGDGVYIYIEICDVGGNCKKQWLHIPVVSRDLENDIKKTCGGNYKKINFDTISDYSPAPLVPKKDNDIFSLPPAIRTR